MTEQLAIGRVVDLRQAACDVRIDRRTPWGNPYVIGRDGDRAAVIGKHRAWLWSEIAAGARQRWRWEWFDLRSPELKTEIRDCRGEFGTPRGRLTLPSRLLRVLDEGQA